MDGVGQVLNVRLRSDYDFFYNNVERSWHTILNKQAEGHVQLLWRSRNYHTMAEVIK